MQPKPCLLKEHHPAGRSAAQPLGSTLLCKRMAGNLMVCNSRLSPGVAKLWRLERKNEKEIITTLIPVPIGSLFVPRVNLTRPTGLMA
jgi:hypothetical protein